MERYIKNIPALNLAENERLRECKVCVAGCGGLGGYIIEMLGRLGVGNMTAVDGDVFQKSNLNRQILSDTNSIGKNKALLAVERMKKVNPTINITPITQMMSLNNSEEIIYGHDLVMDAFDTIESKLMLQDICDKLNIPMIHGAVSGWFGQVASIFPGDKTLNKIYTSCEIDSISSGTPSFSPGLTASIQCSEAIKVLINRGEIVRNGFLFIDMLSNTFQIIKL